MTKPVILCVGTTKVSGDSLGPKVGDKLIEHDVDAYVYGKSSRPVNGINYPLFVDHIKTHHKGSVIIAVDTCVGKKEDLGKIKYTFKGLRAGSALNKSLEAFGDIGILGVVGESGKDNLSSLAAADSRLVGDTAERIAEKIFDIVKNMKFNYKNSAAIFRPEDYAPRC